MNLGEIMAAYPIGARLRIKDGDCFPGRTREVCGYRVYADRIHVEFVEDGIVDAARLEELLEE